MSIREDSVQNVKQAYGVQDHVIGAFRPVQDVKQGHGVSDNVIGAFKPLQVLIRCATSMVGTKI
jgi:hypothetical protein